MQWVVVWSAAAYAGFAMWTAENRARYNRSKLRYPSDLTDEEWALVSPLIPPAKRGGNKRTVDVWEVVNGLMYILSTGCQWAALPKDLPPRSTVHDYFARWAQRARRCGTARWAASTTPFTCGAASLPGARRTRPRLSSTARA